MEKYIKMMRKKHNDNSKSSLNDNNQSKSSLVEQQAVPSNDSNIEYLQAPPKIQRPSSASVRHHKQILPSIYLLNISYELASTNLQESIR